MFDDIPINQETPSFARCRACGPMISDNRIMTEAAGLAQRSRVALSQGDWLGLPGFGPHTYAVGRIRERTPRGT